jgi:hypothetical protein
MIRTRNLRFRRRDLQPIELSLEDKENSKLCGALCRFYISIRWIDKKVLFVVT